MDKVHFSTGKDDWETPQWLFNQLDDEFHFTLDPCCTAENAKCRKYYTKAENGLEQDWKGETVFCNPPYSRGKKGAPGQEAWIKKCFEESKKSGYNLRYAASSAYGHEGISHIHIWICRNQIYSREIKVWRKHK